MTWLSGQPPSSIKFREKKVAANRLRFSHVFAHGKGSHGPSAQVRFSQKHGFFISDLAVSWRWNLSGWDLDQDLPVQVLGFENSQQSDLKIKWTC